jgi:5-methylcytosine-specific restriction endonuclease McrA
VKVPRGVRATVLSRDKGRCARCNVWAANTPSDVHHRKPRGMGGTRDVRSKDHRNLVLLCRSCHGDVESHRALAYDTGWLIRSYNDLDRPLYSKDGRRIELTLDPPYRVDVTDTMSLLTAASMT